MKFYRLWIPLWCAFGLLALVGCEQKSSTQTATPTVQAPVQSPQYQADETQQISNAMFNAGSFALKASKDSFSNLENTNQLLPAERVV